MDTVDVLGLKVTCAGPDELNREIVRLAQGERPAVVLSANANAFNLARTRPWLVDFFRRADLVHVDGSSIVLAVSFLYGRKVERSTWADWVWSLAETLAQSGFSLFLLGGEPGLAEKAAQSLEARVPDLRIAGVHHGFFDKKGPENDRVVDLINRSGADFLWIGLGMPAQEAWLLENQPRLNGRVLMVCGGAFKHISGLLHRAPRWFLDHHLEWLYLFLQDPRRGFRRYLIGNPVFLLELLLAKIKLVVQVQRGRWAGL